MSKNEQLDELFEDWKLHYKSYGIDSAKFSKDGIINEERFNQASKKLLFVLRETNDYPEGDLRELYKDGPRFGTAHQLAKWAAGVLKGFPKYEDVDKGDVLTESIRSIAIMNMKKFTGEATVDYRQLSAFAFLDKKYIKEQVTIIDPEIIVCCNTFTEIMWVLEINEIKTRLRNLDDAFDDPFNVEGMKIIDWPYHPAARGSHKEKYKKLETQLRGKI